MHNLQTIGIKSPEKARKIIEETIEEFIRLAMHLEAIGLEKTNRAMLSIFTYYII